WNGRTRIDFARLVLPGHELLLRPLVVDVRDIRLVEHRFELRRWDEVNAFAIAEDDVSGHDRRVADAHGCVDCRQHHVADRSRVDTANVDSHVDRVNTFQITHRAVDYQATALGRGVDRGRQIVAYESAAFDLAEQIHNEDVARLQRV